MRCQAAKTLASVVCVRSSAVCQSPQSRNAVPSRREDAASAYAVNSSSVDVILPALLQLGHCGIDSPGARRVAIGAEKGPARFTSGPAPPDPYGTMTACSVMPRPTLMILPICWVAVSMGIRTPSLAPVGPAMYEG